MTLLLEELKHVMDLNLFNRYEKIRRSGKYNMLLDWREVMLEMKLNPQYKSDKYKYMDILANYSELAKTVKFS